MSKSKRVHKSTGPFAQLGTWSIYSDTNSSKLTASSKLKIVKATRKYINYTRKCMRYDPKGHIIRRGKIYSWYNSYRVDLGSYEYITVEREKETKSN